MIISQIYCWLQRLWLAENVSKATRKYVAKPAAINALLLLPLLILSTSKLN